MKRIRIALLILLTPIFTVRSQVTNTFPNNGNVGIGTTTPTEKLQVYDDVNGPVYLGICNNNTSGNSVSGLKIGMGDQYDIGTYLYHKKNDNTFYFENTGAPISKFAFTTRRQDGTYGIRLSISENGRLYQRGDIPNDNNAIFVNMAGNGYGLYSKGGTGTRYSFHFENHAGQSILLGRGNGNVGIGTTTPDAKLAVKGDIHAQEVKVDLTVPAPDYVFKEGYKLRTLEETQNYIDEHGHLPNIPSASEMEENGIELGEMNMKLLEKIEELTLYTLKQEENLKNQRIELAKRDYRILLLEERMNKMEKLLKQ